MENELKEFKEKQGEQGGADALVKLLEAVIEAIKEFKGEEKDVRKNNTKRGS